MRIIECEQNTDEWQQARLGHITSSNFDKVLSKGSGNKTYMYRVITERLTGVPEPTFQNKYMEQGIELEAEAKELYETTQGVSVQEVGFIEVDDWIGCSPDGLVGDDGVVEIKCPKATTHVRYINENKLPNQYKAQVQGVLYVSGREWCDFISYSPQVSMYPMFTLRVERDEEYIKELEITLTKFKAKAQKIYNKILESEVF